MQIYVVMWAVLMMFSLPIVAEAQSSFTMGYGVAPMSPFVHNPRLHGFPPAEVHAGVGHAPGFGFQDPFAPQFHPPRPTHFFVQNFSSVGQHRHGTTTTMQYSRPGLFYTSTHRPFGPSGAFLFRSPWFF